MRNSNRFIDLKELQSLVPLSRTTIWRMEQAGQFPARIRIGKRRVGWRLLEVEEWMDCRQSVGAPITEEECQTNV